MKKVSIGWMVVIAVITTAVILVVSARIKLVEELIFGKLIPEESTTKIEIKKIVFE